MIEAAEAAHLRSAVVTFDPHPRTVLGAPVELLTTLERRLELLDEAGVDEVLVVRCDEALLALAPEVFAETVLRPIGAEVVAAGDGFRFGHGRRGDLDLLARLGFPTANLALLPELLVPGLGIYAGSALGHRAAISIGTNPHFGGTEPRVEAFLLDFAGDLYGRRLVVELWERLRDEAAFGSEAELVEAIETDVARTRSAVRPA